MDHNLLISELQTLGVESKRRHPEVKEASDHALDILKVKPLPKETVIQNADKVLAPILLGCKTKVAKIIGISIAALQRLVTLGGVSTDALPGVFQTLTSVANQGVDIQLKILQTVLSILSYNPDVHETILGDALLLCFRLQDSRVSVVSSTAAATLRQAVMVIFDRVSTDDSVPLLPLELPQADGKLEIKLTPASMDAYDLFSDLCLLTASSGSGFSLWSKGNELKPKLLKLSHLQRTFGLELIESILSGYESRVKEHPELLYLLSHSLDPLLLQLLGEKPTFPIALRVCRLIFLLIRSFTDQMPLQVEIYISTLIRIGSGESVDGSEEQTKKDTTAPWLRGLALEILRGICGDGNLLQTIWSKFDRSDGPKLFSKLVNALGRLVSERPVLLGIGVQMHGVGVPTGDGHSAGYLDMGIGMVTSAASAGMSTVNSMIRSSGGGLGPQSALKLKLIELHDKAEAPPIPETYPYLLALQSLDAVAEGVYVAAGQPSRPQETIKGMAESSWPALLAALSYCMGTNLSDGLFAEVLSAVQDFAVACGLLNLVTPRDAFLSTLEKYAVPPPVVSAMQSYMEAPSSRNNSVLNVDNLGLAALAGGASGPPSLSERNLACLRSTVTTARILAASLGAAWHDILETLQNANFLLATKKPVLTKKPSMMSPKIAQSPTMSEGSPDPGAERSEIYNDLDFESIQAAINVLFDGSRDLDDEAFEMFVKALCQLSSEMIGMDAEAKSVIDLTDGPLLSPRSPNLERPMIGESTRRASGLNISHTIKSGERSFSLSKLRTVAALNLSRLVNQPPEKGWAPITLHLLAIARHPSAAVTIRMQGSDTLGELLLGAIRVGKESRVQHQVFDVLVRQVDVNPVSSTVSTDFDVRASGYSTLNQILESSGHFLEVGWQTIFDMLNSVCRDTTSPEMASHTSPLGPPHRPPALSLSKGDVNLVRIAFPSLTLICTDFLSSLDDNAMRQCISCLGRFGRQKEDVNITLAAIGLLWNVSDAVQAGRPEIKALWLVLLSELLELCRDPRLEVRSSAMQTIFRCVELYGSRLSSQIWEDVLSQIIFPLLEAAKADESAVLALTSIGNIFNTFISLITSLPSFKTYYAKLIDRVKLAFATEPRDCGTASLKALDRVLVAMASHTSNAQLETRDFILDSTWDAFKAMSDDLSGSEVYTQDNLVALTRLASLLHDQITWTDERLADFSMIMRALMAYTKSPDTRPDVDVMSPLQEAVTNLVATSKHLSVSLILCDLAEFASLAYMREDGAKLSYVAVSKFALPRMATILLQHATSKEIYEDGTIENVIGAYSIPIKLKYDCPASSKYGDDPPLWKTAITSFGPVVGAVIDVMDDPGISEERCTGVWTQIIDVLAGILLADNSGGANSTEDDEAFILPSLDIFKSAVIPRLPKSVPDNLIRRYGEILRKASELYHFDVPVNRGTTAPSIPNASETLRYWAFDLLFEAVTSEAGQPSDGHAKVAKLVMPELIRRIKTALSQFIEDTKLRGRMPLGQVREDELLYMLRQLATLRLIPNTLTDFEGKPFSSALASSPRAHLVHFYPQLLELSFLSSPLPSLWMFPSEYNHLFGLGGETRRHSGTSIPNGDANVDAGDGTNLVEVGARDIARTCLELVGTELGLAMNNDRHKA